MQTSSAAAFSMEATRARFIEIQSLWEAEAQDARRANAILFLVGFMASLFLFVSPRTTAMAIGTGLALCYFTMLTFMLTVLAESAWYGFSKAADKAAELFDKQRFTTWRW